MTSPVLFFNDLITGAYDAHRVTTRALTGSATTEADDSHTGSAFCTAEPPHDDDSDESEDWPGGSNVYWVPRHREDPALALDGADAAKDRAELRKFALIRLSIIHGKRGAR